MEVKPGYKKTEVGVIPEDWEPSTIGENSKWMSGGTPRRNNTEFWSGTIPWISGSTLKHSEISTSDQFLTIEAVSVGSKMAPVDSTLLLVRGSALHNEIRAGLVVLPVAFNQDVKALVPDLTVTPKFLTYYILAKSDELLKLVSSAGNSAGVLDTELVQHFTFLKPPIHEQRAIATALSDVDALLTKLDQLITKKRDIKQAAMQQLLTGQTRLPGFEGEWEVKRLGELLSYEQPTNYLVSSIEYSNANDIPVLTAGKTFILGYTNEIHGIFYNLPVIIFDDFTTASKYVNFPFKAKSSAMKILRPRNPSVNLRLVFDMMQLVEFKLGDHKRYWISEYQKLEVKIPDAPEQTAIATILSDMDAEITALESKLAKARQLKQGMMQELLTGRIRLI